MISLSPPTLTQNTQEMLVRAFDKNQLLKGSRNWCMVEEKPLVAGSVIHDGAITFQVKGVE